jgi:hypothetical protein
MSYRKKLLKLMKVIFVKKYGWGPPAWTLHLPQFSPASFSHGTQGLNTFSHGIKGIK